MYLPLGRHQGSVEALQPLQKTMANTWGEHVLKTPLRGKTGNLRLLWGNGRVIHITSYG